MPRTRFSAPAFTSLPAVFTGSDGAGPQVALASNSYPQLNNGDTGQGSFDRQRGNVDLTLLSSAARTAAVVTATKVNYNGRGVIVTVNVTVASGTGGLTIRVMGVDPVTGVQYIIFTAAAPITTTGIKTYVVYPGAGAAAAGITGSASFPLPRTWAVDIAVGDASSYTYSVGAHSIL